MAERPELLGLAGCSGLVSLVGSQGVVALLSDLHRPEVNRDDLAYGRLHHRASDLGPLSEDAAVEFVAQVYRLAHVVGDVDLDDVLALSRENDQRAPLVSARWEPRARPGIGGHDIRARLRAAVKIARDADARTWQRLGYGKLAYGATENSTSL